MKPLKLTMQAFGSYVKPGTIDFEKPEQNLFLITGDTGAGKTTIFDAIVFALYGEASSGTNKKSGNELQSQYAKPELRSFRGVDIFRRGWRQPTGLYGEKNPAAYPSVETWNRNERRKRDRFTDFTRSDRIFPE